MVCEFVHAKLLKWQENSIFFIFFFFGWLTLEMIKLDDYHAILQKFYELAKLIFLWNQFLWTFYHFGF